MTARNFWLVVCCMFLSIWTFAKTAQHFFVLAIDHDHDHILTEQTLKKGQDLLLVRVNPPNLSPEQVIFQTDKFNVYTTATIKDLQAPDAIKRLWVAKMKQDNTIRVYTLANLGYNAVQPRKNAANELEFFLVGAHNKQDQVMLVSFKPSPVPIYDPSKDKDLLKKMQPVNPQQAQVNPSEKK